METGKIYVFYDLETNGLDWKTTGIMQMSILDINGSTILNQYTYPFDNRIGGTEIHHIDEEKLVKNNAISTIELCILIKKILRERYDRNDIYLIAYNNFGYDQNILENNFKISNIKIPNNWYFTDLFPIIKELYPNIKPNHKLITVFENICGKDDSINFHCSLGDTTCLYRLFNKIGYNPTIFNKYTRSLMSNNKIKESSISSINGYHSSLPFNSNNIHKIGDLFNIYHANNFDNDKFDAYLERNLNIYSKYFRSNLVKQVDFIHYLSK